MDLQLKETFDGGDFVMKRNDISVIEGFENMPYIGMFGGNPGFSTPSRRLRSQQNFDFWGNEVFAANNLSLQFNSNTEHALNTIPLTSGGRILIEQAVKRDLQFMRPFARVGVAVTISGVDRLIIAVRIIQPENLQQRDFIYIWDATKNELLSKDGQVITGNLTVPPVIDAGIFDFSFDESFE
jgi:hypothetical protein